MTATEQCEFNKLVMHFNHMVCRGFMRVRVTCSMRELVFTGGKNVLK